MLFSLSSHQTVWWGNLEKCIWTQHGISLLSRPLPSYWFARRHLCKWMGTHKQACPCRYSSVHTICSFVWLWLQTRSCVRSRRAASEAHVRVALPILACVCMCACGRVRLAALIKLQLVPIGNLSSSRPHAYLFIIALYSGAEHAARPVEETGIVTR